MPEETAIDSSGPPAENQTTPVANGRPLRVIFLLYRLPLEPEDQFEEDADIARRITTTYKPALGMILGTPLQYAGKVEKILINFGEEGIFELSPKAEYLTSATPGVFEKHLRILFERGHLFKRTGRNRTGIARKIPDMVSLLAAIPDDCLKIGCLSGSTNQGLPELTDFIASIDDKSFLFVIGDFVNDEIVGHLDTLVKVSDYSLDPTTAVSKIVFTVENKWNLT